MSQLLSRWCPWPAATLFLCFSPTSFKLLNSTPMQKILLEGRLLDMGGWQRGDLRLTCPPLWPWYQAKVRCYETGGRADNVNREQGQGQPCPEGMVSSQNFLHYFTIFLKMADFCVSIWCDMIRPLKLETPFSPLKWPDFPNKHITHFDLYPIHCIHCMHW